MAPFSSRACSRHRPYRVRGSRVPCWVSPTWLRRICDSQTLVIWVIFGITARKGHSSMSALFERLMVVRVVVSHCMVSKLQSIAHGVHQERAANSVPRGAQASGTQRTLGKEQIKTGCHRPGEDVERLLAGKAVGAARGTLTRVHKSWRSSKLLERRTSGPTQTKNQILVSPRVSTSLRTPGKNSTSQKSSAARALPRIGRSVSPMRLKVIDWRVAGPNLG